MDIQKVTRLIHSDYSSFAVNCIKLIGSGCDNDAFLINGTHIFLFPKRAEVRQKMYLESQLLPLIQKTTSVKVPHFQFISAKGKFVGYPIIAGEPMSETLFESFSDDKKQLFVKSIADFLNSMQTIKVENKEIAKKITIDTKEKYAYEKALAQKLLVKIFSPADMKKINQKYDAYLSEKTNFDYSPALLHNDLSLEHIIIDEQNQKIAGIIDFGDIARGDPDIDLTHFYLALGENATIQLLNYSNKNTAHRLLKIKFFAFAKQIEILMNALENKEQSEIQAGILTVQSLL